MSRFARITRRDGGHGGTENIIFGEWETHERSGSARLEAQELVRQGKSRKPLHKRRRFQARRRTSETAGHSTPQRSRLRPPLAAPALPVERSPNARSAMRTRPADYRRPAPVRRDTSRAA